MSHTPHLLIAENAASLPHAARTLLQEAEAESLFQGLDWWQLFERHVAQPSGARCAYACLQRGENVLAVLPLMQPARPSLSQGFKPWLKSRLRPHQWQALSNYYTGLYAPILHPQATAQDIAELLLQLAQAHRITPSKPAPLEAHHRIHHLTLTPLSETCTETLQEAAHAAGLRCSATPAFGNWHQRIATGTTAFHQYWSARPGALRNTVARAQRRFAHAGGRISIVNGQHPQELAQAHQAYADVYARSWKPPEALESFMPALIELAAQRGWLRLGIAWMQRRPIAAHLWLVSGAAHARRAEIFKLAYDEDAARHSAGSLLGHALMQHVIEHDQVTEVDYLSGDDDYKRLWMDSRRQRLQLELILA